MHFKVFGQAVDQAVIGVGQFAVAGETRWPRAAEQGFKARVFADSEAPTQRVETLTVNGQRHQPFAV